MDSVFVSIQKTGQLITSSENVVKELRKLSKSMEIKDWLDLCRGPMAPLISACQDLEYDLN
jgi:hypothetical protein